MGTVPDPDRCRGIYHCVLMTDKLYVSGCGVPTRTDAEVYRCVLITDKLCISGCGVPTRTDAEVHH